MNSILNSVIDQTARRLGINPKYTSLIYKSYWKFVRERIAELELEKMEEQDFKEVSTNFNIPYIGKLYTNYDKIKKYNKKVKYLQDHVKNKRNQTDVQSSIGD